MFFKIISSIAVFFAFSLWNNQIQATPQKIRIGVPNIESASFLPLFVAKKEGFFENEGLTMELVQVRNNVAIPALMGNDIDYMIMLSTFVIAVHKGLPVRVISGFIDRPFFAIVAHPKITSILELRNKKLGVGGLSLNASNIIARQIVEHYGIDPNKDLEIVDFKTDQLTFTALMQGVVDAATLNTLATAKAEQSGFKVLARASDILDYPTSALGTTVKKIEQNPNEVKKVIRILLKAFHYIRTNKDGTIRIIADQFKLDTPIATLVYEQIKNIFSENGELSKKGLWVVTGMIKRQLQLLEDIDAEKVLDYRLLYETRKERKN